jgi:hypothetical protein
VNLNALYHKAKLSLRLSLRSMRSHLSRTALTALGIALGVGVVLGVNITNASLLASFNQVFDEAGGKADLTVLDQARGAHALSTAVLAATALFTRFTGIRTDLSGDGGPTWRMCVYPPYLKIFGTVATCHVLRTSFQVTAPCSLHVGNVSPSESGISSVHPLSRHAHTPDSGQFSPVFPVILKSWFSIQLLLPLLCG